MPKVKTPAKIKEKPFAAATRRGKCNGRVAAGVGGLLSLAARVIERADCLCCGNGCWRQQAGFEHIASGGHVFSR